MTNWWVFKRNQKRGKLFREAVIGSSVKRQPLPYSVEKAINLFRKASSLGISPGKTEEEIRAMDRQFLENFCKQIRNKIHGHLETKRRLLIARTEELSIVLPPDLSIPKNMSGPKLEELCAILEQFITTAVATASEKSAEEIRVI